MVLGRTEFYVGRRRRRNAALPAFMSIAALSLAAVLFVLLRPTLTGVITDAYSGEPLKNVRVAYGGQRVSTDAAGRFNLTPKRSAATLSVTPPAGYACDNREISPGDSELLITCRPTILSGTLRHKLSEEPLQGVTVRAVTPENAAASEAVSDENGHYVLADVPADARLIVEGAGFARKEVEIGGATVIDLELRPDVIAGTVRARSGGPVPGATVGARGVSTTVQPNGSYSLSGIPEDARVVARAPGYQARMVEPGDDQRIDFVLEPLVVRAIYLTPEVMIHDDKFNALLALADRTEINAMVIDFKDESGFVYHDSQVSLAREFGVVYPKYDLASRLQTLHEHNIYTIARIVCMLDPALATARPEWAVRNSKTGRTWKNANGIAWVNAMRPEVWRYNTDFALEAARLGFDEIQYDYVRFPSDGDMEAIDLGGPNNLATRTEAIHQFLKLTHDTLAQYGVALGADIFGIAMWDPNDTGIGQQLERIAPVVDYICPMIYPSHFYPGSLGFKIPNDHPYEVILESLLNGDKRIANARVKFRPWLQDFTYGPGIDYGPTEVRAQIEATYAFGATGWMLWNANATFTEAALHQEKR